MKCLYNGTSIERSDLLDVARKNLDDTLLHSAWREVFSHSGRRDDSHEIQDIRVLLSYLYFSHLDKNPVYSAVCDLIEIIT